MAQALVAREIQLAQMGGPAILAAGVAGTDVTFVTIPLNTTPIVIMGNVTKIEELKGKAVGITGFGSNTDISARFAIRKARLQPEKDVVLVQLEDYARIMVGSLLAVSPRARWRIRLRTRPKNWATREIAVIASMGLEFTFVGIAAKKSYIKDNADTAQRCVRAYTEAIGVYKNNRDLAIKVTSKYSGVKDTATSVRLSIFMRRNCSACRIRRWAD
jgi:ABC-type nitrate/sulfonate/bicarbonate transport system substrate-binding protein